MNLVYKFLGTLFYFVAYPVCYIYYYIKNLLVK